MPAAPRRSLEDFFDLVRERISLAEFIGQYTTLTSKGANQYGGLCPIHNEKSPSFSVNDDKGVWYCFGCSKGGNIFTFLKEKEGLDFRDAAELLAARYNIPFEASPQQRAERSERGILEELHTAALAYFQKTLLGPQGTAFQQYLRNREFGRADVERFRLGAALDQWDGLTQVLTRGGFAPQEILTAGLGSRSEKNPEHIYDRFRDRLMIPIANRWHQPIAFGGRIIGPGEPKYLNSPETPLFKKNQTLFALDLAREAIKTRGFAVLMEGYTDVMRAHQKGLTFAIAAMGTALTTNQIEQLQKYTETVVLMLDADQAGLHAAFKHTEALLNARLTVRVIVLGTGSDPDEFLRTSPDPVADFEARLARAYTGIEFRLRSIVPKEVPTDPTARAELVRQGAQLVQVLGTRPERVEWMERFAGLIGWNPNSVLEIAGPYLDRGTASAPLAHTVPRPAAPELEVPALDRELLRTLLLDPASRLLGCEHLRLQDFAHPVYRRVLAILQQPDFPRHAPDISELPIWQTDPAAQQLCWELIAAGAESPPNVETVKQQLGIFRMRQVRDAMARAQARQEAARAAGDDAAVARAMEEMGRLAQILKILMTRRWPEDEGIRVSMSDSG